MGIGQVEWTAALHFAGTVRTDAPHAAPGIGFESYDEQGPILRWDIDGDGFTGTGPRWKFIATKRYFAKSALSGSS